MSGSGLSLAGRTVFVSGASRGIGLAIATACAAQGARIVIAAKTDRPNPKLPGTIHTAAEEIRACGGEALALACDIRDGDAVARAVEAAVDRFGGLDIVVNNASAISLTGTAETSLKRYDLMTGVNARGSFAVTQAALPHLLLSDAAHILTIAPPPDLSPRWFARHGAYSLAKYGMSLLTMAWAEEFRGRIAASCLWPRTTIDTAAVRNLLGGSEMAEASRTPRIMGDAAVAILLRGHAYTGRFCLDDLVLAAEGVCDFDAYAVRPGVPLQPDFFVPTDAPPVETAQGLTGWRITQTGRLSLV
ncbi:MAG: SDR family oxidoreductase [Pikeienuella sp.]